MAEKVFGATISEEKSSSIAYLELLVRFLSAAPLLLLLLLLLLLQPRQVFYRTSHFIPTRFYILWIFINVHQNPCDAVTTNCGACRRLLSVVDELAKKPSTETLQQGDIILPFYATRLIPLNHSGQCDVYIHDMSMFCFVLFQSPLNLNIYIYLLHKSIFTIK